MKQLGGADGPGEADREACASQSVMLEGDDRGSDLCITQ